MKLAQDAYILVCDDRGFVLLRNEGDDADLNLKVVERSVFAASDRRERTPTDAAQFCRIVHPTKPAGYCQPAVAAVSREAESEGWLDLVIAGDPGNLHELRPLMRQLARVRVVAEILTGNADREAHPFDDHPDAP